MTIYLRMILLVASLLTFAYVVRRIRKAQVQLEDTIFWLLTSFCFIILSIFPQIPTYVSKLMGFQAPVNFIFLFVIFLLLVKLFLLSIKVSQLENKLKILVEEIGVRENIHQKQEKDEP